MRKGMLRTSVCMDGTSTVRCTRIPLSVCLRCGVERRAGGGVTAPVLFIQNYYSTYYGTTNSYYVLEYYRTT